MKPINVVIGVLRSGNQYLFVKRNSNSYNGLWGLPEGKVEAHEHLDDTIVRGFREETVLRVHCTAVVGVVSELIIEQDVSNM
ncbi:NUDIX domain-containing protein [Cohnella algarum]|uniref:NUDIX domain-containing protein n=1 Tax=Cohnella algarum TaxID=2044859 RepID=UPI0019685D5F|nr:NUDIX domain-containing protein [Cohnella algarum]